MAARATAVHHDIASLLRIGAPMSQVEALYGADALLTRGRTSHLHLNVVLRQLARDV